MTKLVIIKNGFFAAGANRLEQEVIEIPTGCPGFLPSTVESTDELPTNENGLGAPDDRTLGIVDASQLSPPLGGGDGLYMYFSDMPIAYSANEEPFDAWIPFNPANKFCRYESLNSGGGPPSRISLGNTPADLVAGGWIIAGDVGVSADGITLTSPDALSPASIMFPASGDGFAAYTMFEMSATLAVDLSATIIHRQDDFVSIADLSLAVEASNPLFGVTNEGYVNGAGGFFNQLFERIDVASTVGIDPQTNPIAALPKQVLPFRFASSVIPMSVINLPQEVMPGGSTGVGFQVTAGAQPVTLTVRRFDHLRFGPSADYQP